MELSVDPLKRYLPLVSKASTLPMLGIVSTHCRVSRFHTCQKWINQTVTQIQNINWYLDCGVVRTAEEPVASHCQAQHACLVVQQRLEALERVHIPHLKSQSPSTL